MEAFKDIGDYDIISQMRTQRPTNPRSYEGVISSNAIDLLRTYKSNPMSVEGQDALSDLLALEKLFVTQIVNSHRPSLRADLGASKYNDSANNEMLSNGFIGLINAIKLADQRQMSDPNAFNDLVRSCVARAISDPGQSRAVQSSIIREARKNFLDDPEEYDEEDSFYRNSVDDTAEISRFFDKDVEHDDEDYDEDEEEESAQSDLVGDFQDQDQDQDQEGLDQFSYDNDLMVDKDQDYDENEEDEQTYRTGQISSNQNDYQVVLDKDNADDYEDLNQENDKDQQDDFEDDSSYRSNILAGANRTGYDPKFVYDDRAKAYQLRCLRTYKNDPNSQEGQEAFSQLIRIKHNYVVAIAFRMIRSGKLPRNATLSQAISEGDFGLINGIRKYNYIEGSTIYQYTKYISSYITGAIRNKFNPQRNKSITDDGKTTAVITYDADGKKHVQKKSLVGRSNRVSMDAKIEGSRGQWADKDTTVGDVIADPSAINSPDQIQKDQMLALLRQCLSQLTQQQYNVIYQLYFQRKTLKQIGAALGISDVAVHARKSKILAKLKSKLLYQKDL